MAFPDSPKQRLERLAMAVGLSADERTDVWSIDVAEDGTPYLAVEFTNGATATVNAVGIRFGMTVIYANGTMTEMHDLTEAALVTMHRRPS